MNKAAHPDNQELKGYQLRTLAPADLLAVDPHLAECEPCRARLAAPAMPALAELRAQFTEHLDYDQIVKCSEGRGGAALEQHLAECELCRAEVLDLKNFKGELASFPRSKVVAMPAPVKKSRTPVWAGVAAGTILVAGLSYWSLRSSGNPQPPPVLLAQAPPAEAVLPADQQSAIQAALSEHKLERAAVLDRLITQRGVLLGTPGEARTFDLAAPMGTSVLTDRPVFRWQAVPGAAQYVVSLFDDTFHKVGESPILTAAEWQPAQPLERGRVYNWQVSAKVGGATLRSPLPPAPEARFQVAGAQQAVEIEKARRDHPANHLLLAVLMAKAGALDDAAGELDELAVTDAATAQALRTSLVEIRKK
ncbi:MAG: hypothetical protein ABI806_14140 [Candidatus Solibacter sp.]